MLIMMQALVTGFTSTTAQRNNTKDIIYQQLNISNSKNITHILNINIFIVIISCKLT